MTLRPTVPPAAVRCGIYGRKSTDVGLDKEFNSLDAQREAGEAYVASQAAQGWVCRPERFEDGGYTGGNMDRPALQRLLALVETGQVEVVVVYKLDRLSRSLLDFARLMAVFERHGVALVSVTQRFDTSTSMGRLVLNMLLSFAEFERDIIRERTRDKIAAARRRGKWSGGHPLLGYDVDAKTTKLVVNQDEAIRVRAIFELYRAQRALLPVVQELERRGWPNKRWTTRRGRERGGRPFTKTSLHQLLRNVAYIGQVRHKRDVYPGEQDAIVDTGTWQEVQTLLRRPQNRTRLASRPGVLLQGLLFCKPCGCAMTPSYSTRGTKRYRYYVCVAAQKRGWAVCPSKSLPAGAVEAFVVGQFQRLSEVPEPETVSDDDRAALTDLGNRWARLTAVEQRRIIHLFVERVDYDGGAKTIAVQFHSTALHALRQLEAPV